MIRVLICAGVLGALCGALVAGARPWVRRETSGRIYRSLGTVPPRSVGIVFGALVTPQGTLAPVLRERVEAGVALYRAGKVSKLLMTGDNGRVGYDEVTPMKRYAVSLGVPPQDVVRDYAGFRTYDSCYRARDIFGVRDAVLVTQEFHLPRAVYLARRLGIDAVGYAASPGLDPRSLAALEAREYGACASAVLDLLIRRRPRFLGPREPLFANEIAGR